MKKNLNPIFKASVGIIFGFLMYGCEKESPQEQVANHIFLAESYFKQGQLSASAIESNNALQIDENAAQAHFILAKALLITGDAVNAEIRLKKAISADTANLEYQFTLIDALIQLKRFDEAEAYLQKLPTDKLNSALSYYLQGRIAFNRQNGEAAKQAFNNALQIDNNYVAAMIGLAKTELAVGNESEGIQWIKRAQAVNEKDIETLLLLGEYYNYKKQYSIAEENFTKALSYLNSQDVMSAQKYAAYEGLVKTLTQQGRDTDALRYKKILAESPQGRVNAKLESAVQAYKAGDFLRAEKEFNSILTYAPKHSATQAALGAIEFIKGDLKSAEDHLEKAALNSKGLNLETYKLLATTRLELGKIPEAEELIRNGLDKFPNDYDLLTLNALIHIRQGQIPFAIKELNNLLEKDNARLSTRLVLASAYIDQGDLLNAREQFRLAASTNPKSLAAFKGWISTYSNPEELQAELPVFEKIAEDNTNSGAVWWALNMACLKLGDMSCALNAGEKAQELLPKNIHVTQTLAITYLQNAHINYSKSQTEHALEDLKKAREIQPDLIPALALQAKILSNLQKSDEAELLIKDFIELNPDVNAGYEILGDLKANQNELEKALNNYQIAWTQHRSQALALKIAKLKPIVSPSSNSKSSSQPLTLESQHIRDWMIEVEDVLKNDPQNEEALSEREEVISSLALVTQEQGNWEESTKLYQKLVNLYPQSPVHWNNLAWNLQELEKFDEALIAVAQARKIAPYNLDIMDTEGWILVRNGNINKAIEIFIAGLKVDPNHVGLKDHLSKAQNSR